MNSENPTPSSASLSESSSEGPSHVTPGLREARIAEAARKYVSAWRHGGGVGAKSAWDNLFSAVDAQVEGSSAAGPAVQGVAWQVDSLRHSEGSLRRVAETADMTHTLREYLVTMANSLRNVARSLEVKKAPASPEAAGKGRECGACAGTGVYRDMEIGEATPCGRCDGAGVEPPAVVEAASPAGKEDLRDAMLAKLFQYENGLDCAGDPTASYFEAQYNAIKGGTDPVEVLLDICAKFHRDTGNREVADEFLREALGAAGSPGGGQEADAQLEAALNRPQIEAARLKLGEAMDVYAPYALASQGNYGRGLPLASQRKVWDLLVLAKSFLGEPVGGSPLPGAARLEEGLTWTREKPTREGWYWFRREGSDVAGVIEISGESGVLYAFNTDGESCALKRWDTGDWAGPIVEPGSTEGAEGAK